MLTSLLTILALTASPHGSKVLVLQLNAGEGVSESVATAITDAVTSESRKRPGQSVLTSKDVTSLLSVERQKQLMGCTENSCMAELGGALGADRIVSGSVAKLGASWLIHLQLIDARKANVIGQADRRKKGGSIDDVLDELPKMVDELFGPAGFVGAVAAQPPPTPATTPPPAQTAAPAQPPVAAPTPIKLPPPGADEPAALGAVMAKLKVITDGHGRYIAFEPFGGMDGAFLAGDEHALHQQYVGGGGSEGDKAFDLVFWEPRVQRPAEAEFDFRDGVYKLTCKNKEIVYTALDAAKAKKFLAKAKLYKPRWRRTGLALGRDEDGTYYYVDGPRSDEPSDDLHLYVGKKGAVVPVKVTDVQRDGGTLLLQTEHGLLKLPLFNDRAQKQEIGEWKNGATRTPVTTLDLWPNRAMIYTQLGAYTGEKLGTACDGAL